MDKKEFDCFRIEKSMKQDATRMAKDEGCSRAAIYRKAFIEYKEKHDKKK